MFLSTRLIAFVSAFLALWMLHRLQSVSSRDPTSVFFSPRAGYTPRYSAIRLQQAQRVITAANTSDHAAPPNSRPSERKLCVGIPSMARKGAQYLRDTVGSLLEGLTEEERAEIHFTVFIPHSDPTVHPAYTETWLPALTDEVLTYDVSLAELEHIKQMEQEAGEYLEKGLFDYRYLLKYCAAQQTPYMAIFEDDIVAMDGWYHRTIAALDQVERKSALQHASTEFLYLRLFYTEEFLGWNSENWRKYLIWSIIAFTTPMGFLTYLRARSPVAKRIFTDRARLAIGVLITAAIGLYFALGRITVRPMAPGVSLMPRFGCCSQGFVFPRNSALAISTYFADRRLGAADVLIEDFANEKGGLRWAINPSVLQHVGRKSSKIDDYGVKSKYGMSVAEKIWSFGFEDQDWGALREEHRRVAEKRRL